MIRGEPEVLRGESGGAPPAGNKEGSGLLPAAFGLLEFPGTLMATPAFASSSKDFICIQMQQQ